MKKRSGKNLLRFFYHLLVVVAMSFPLIYSSLDYGTNQLRQFQENENLIQVDNLDKFSEISSEITTTADYLPLENFYPLLRSIASSAPNSYTFGSGYFNFYLAGPSMLRYDFTSSTYYKRNLGGILNDANHNGYLEFDFINNRFIDGNNIYCYSYTDNDYVSLGIDELYDVDTDISYAMIVDVHIDNAYEPLQNAYNNAVVSTISVGGDLSIVFDYSFDISMGKVNSMLNYQFLDFDYLSIIGSPTGIVWDFINTNIQWVLTIAVVSFAPYVLLTFYHLAIGLLDKFMKKGEDL